MALSLTKYFGADPFWSFPLSWTNSSDYFSVDSIWSPPVNVFERDGKYVIEVELAGVEKKDVSVNVEDGFITVSGTKENSKKEEGQGYYMRERSYGSFSRGFKVPSDVEEKDVVAEFKNGVLTVELPIKVEKKPDKKSIEIK
jgi:HSP20 family protein